MMKKYLVPVVVAGLMGLILSGCTAPATSPPGETTPPPAGGEYLTAGDVPELAEIVSSGAMDPELPMNPYAGLAIRPDGTPFRFAHSTFFLAVEWVADADGVVESLVRRAGGEYKIFDPNLDPQKQIGFVEDLIAGQLADGIVIQALHEDLLATVLDQAEASGISVFPYDIELNSENVSSIVHHDFDGPYGTGILGEYYVQYANDTGKQLNIFEIWGDRANPTSVERHEAFHSAIGDNSLITIRESADSMWTNEIVTDLVQDAFTAYPELNAIFVHGGGSAGAPEALRSIGRLLPADDPDHVIIAVNDCDSVLADLLLEEKVDAYGSHGSWDLVDTATKLMLTKVVLGQSVPRHVAIPMALITRENYDSARVLGGPANYPYWMPADYDLWPVLDTWNYPPFDGDTYAELPIKTPTK